MLDPAQPLVIQRAEDLAALADMVRSGRAVLFTGAGCSIPAGYPSWSRLLQELENLCDRCGGRFIKDERLRTDDPLLYADRIKTHIVSCTGNLDRYHKFLADTFGRAPRLTQFHHDLVALPFRGVITTNYDYSIEAALSYIEREPLEKGIILGRDERHREYEFRRSLIAESGPRSVAHIHGYYRWPPDIVLSADDFQRAYGVSQQRLGDGTISLSDTPVAAFVRSILESWPLVFVGFSLNDPYLRAFLSAISDTYQLWGDPNHIAIIDTTADQTALDLERANQLRERYGIQVLFYEAEGGSHQTLYDLIAELRQRMRLLPVPSILDVNRRMAEEMEA